MTPERREEPEEAYFGGAFLNNREHIKQPPVRVEGEGVTFNQKDMEIGKIYEVVWKGEKWGFRNNGKEVEVLEDKEAEAKYRDELKQRIARIVGDEISSEVNFKVSDTWEAAEKILKVVEEER